VSCLSVFGALVPGTLERYLRATFSGERADGFIQRFQRLVYPDLSDKWHYVDRPIDDAVRARAFHVLERIGSLTTDDFHAVKIDEGGGVRVLHPGGSIKDVSPPIWPPVS
jgi:hypothetical protein